MLTQEQLFAGAHAAWNHANEWSGYDGPTHSIFQGLADVLDAMAHAAPTQPPSPNAGEKDE
jgi:hypothetical protein